MLVVVVAGGVCVSVVSGSDAAGGGVRGGGCVRVGGSVGVGVVSGSPGDGDDGGVRGTLR